MSEPDQARSRDERYRDRRGYERYEINASGGWLNCQGSKFPCRIVDVSLSGCSVRTESRFLPGNLANVEVVLPILGMVLRMAGATQWLTRDNLIGVRFFHASSRSKNQLAALLTCLVDENAAEAVRAAVVAAAQSGVTELDAEFPDAWLRNPGPSPIIQEAREHQQLPASLSPSAKPVQSGEERTRNEEQGEWPAVLQILKDGSRLAGVLVGLSLERCSFQTAQPFVAGIYVRVEVGFQMRGLPFRLVGVIENVRNRNTIDIRFLEVSYRKRVELAELIDELREAAKKPSEAAENELL